MLSNNLCYLEIGRIVHPRYHSKDNRKYSKNNCVCIHETMRLIIMKMKMKMNNRSPKPRYSKYKKCRNLMLFIKMNESKPIKNEKKKEKIWKPDENEKQIGLDMDINIVNIKMSLSMMIFICIKQHLRKKVSFVKKERLFWQMVSCTSNVWNNCLNETSETIGPGTISLPFGDILQDHWINLVESH